MARKRPRGLLPRKAAVSRIEEAGERAWVVGKVVQGKQEVLIRG